MFAHVQPDETWSKNVVKEALAGQGSIRRYAYRLASAGTPTKPIEIFEATKLIQIFYGCYCYHVYHTMFTMFTTSITYIGPRSFNSASS